MLRPGSTVCETGDGRIQVTIEMPGVRRPGDFFQAWTLDETINQSRVDAVLRDGLLTLTLDLKEQVKPRTVTIRKD